MFEKLNTGGVPLSVFELVTATWAAEGGDTGFNLRVEWYGETTGKKPKPGIQARLQAKPLLRDVQATDFLQAVSLLYSLEQRKKDEAAWKTGKAVTTVTAKREHICYRAA